MNKSNQICLTLSQEQIDLMNNINKQYYNGEIALGKLSRLFVAYCLSLKSTELEIILNIS